MSRGTINWGNRNFDAAYLRRILFYGTSTGYWFWLVDRGNGRSVAGSRAGCFNNSIGRWIIVINGTQYIASNLAWLWVTGEWPLTEIDHKNRNHSDDRWDNLRLATRTQQNINRGIMSSNTSGAAGVWFNDSYPAKPWHAEIKVDKKEMWLGQYKTREEAIAVRLAAEAKYFGEFAPKYAAE